MVGPLYIMSIENECLHNIFYSCRSLMLFMYIVYFLDVHDFGNVDSQTLRLCFSFFQKKQNTF